MHLVAFSGWELTEGALSTVKMAADDVATGLHDPLTTTSYEPASLLVTDGIVKFEAVAPAMGLPSFLHWYVSPEPPALTLNVAEVPTQREMLLGFVVMLGGILIINVAPVEVTGGGHTPLTITS